jgi:hypothetical protein
MSIKNDCTMLQALRAQDALAIAEVSRRRSRDEQAMYFRAHWIWYGALAWSWLLGRACDGVFRLPTTAKPSALLMVARKPG